MGCSCLLQWCWHCLKSLQWALEGGGTILFFPAKYKYGARGGPAQEMAALYSNVVRDYSSEGGRADSQHAAGPTVQSLASH